MLQLQICLWNNFGGEEIFILSIAVFFEWLVKLFLRYFLLFNEEVFIHLKPRTTWLGNYVAELLSRWIYTVDYSSGESPEMLQSLSRSWFLAYYLIFNLKKAREVVINFYCETALQGESCTNKSGGSSLQVMTSRVAALLKHFNDKCPGFTVTGIACKCK